MGDVPSSLTELKIQIGKNVRTHSMEFEHALSAESQAIINNAPSWQLIGAAERWRAAYPAVAEQVGKAAAQTLEELQTGSRGDNSQLLNSIKTDSEVHDVARSRAPLHLYPILRDVFSGDESSARQCLEALVAYGRGE